MNVAFETLGNTRHQTVLRAIVSYYAGDPRILAVSAFGSIGRGNWDQYSDLDLDLVTADGVEIEVAEELAALCASIGSIGEQAALIIPTADDAGDVMLESLLEFSIRYHTLASTSPNIVDSLQVLWGRIDRAMIVAAGLANKSAGEQPLGRLLDMTVRYLLGADVALKRQSAWLAIELLHRLRGLLLELFAQTHGGGRPYYVFQQQADPQLQARLGETLPLYNSHAIEGSLLAVLDILKNDLGSLTNGQVQLSEAQRRVIGQLLGRRMRNQHP